MYQVIAGGRIGTILKRPTYPDITGYLDDRPVAIILPDTKDLPGGLVTAWVGADFVGREHSGEISREVNGSVLMWTLGANKQPYAGPIVLTAVHESAMNGVEPTPLPVETVFTLNVLMTDIKAVLDGEGEPDPQLPDVWRNNFRVYADQIRYMPYEGLAIWESDR